MKARASKKNPGIKDKETLIAFRLRFKKMGFSPEYTRKSDGTKFRKLLFEDTAGNITEVSFSSNLGQLTAAEIKAQKHSLAVVLLKSGTYKLCRNNVQMEEFDILDDED